jgi:hypothetical protein
MLRSFDSALALTDDGREVIGRIVPLGQVAHIREIGAHGELEEYDEVFEPGCTERMRQVAKSRGGHPAWIRLTLDHGQTEDSRIGFCTSLLEDETGVDGIFRLHADPWRLDKVRSMLTESHTGFSIEFVDHSPPKIEGNLRRRRQIHISAVTATPIPVYASARILAVRADGDPLTSAGTPNLDRVRAMLADV